MIRAAIALVCIAAVAGCASPGAAPTDGATRETPTRSDPFATPQPTSASPSAITPTTLPPTPPPTTNATGYTLRATTADGTPVFIAADGTKNPTLLVPPDTEITIELLRDGEVHAFSVNGETIIPVGSNNARASFLSPASGSFEYGCPVHAHVMRGTITVA